MKIPKIQLSTDTQKLIKSIIEPIKNQYVDHRYKKNEARWLKHYGIIKDPSWPECSSYGDFDRLPDWIKKECENQHEFSPDILLDHIRRDSEINFNVPDALTFDNEVSQFLSRHKHAIENRTIIDFACNRGHYSFLANSLNCKNVTGVDVRSDSILIANTIKKDLALADDKIIFGKSDIHDYQNNQRLCRDKDTVLLLGIMYHVHDHYAIMESVFDTDVKYVMIDTGIFEHDKPIIWWKKEPTFELMAGWYNNHDTILVGYPSVSWFDLVAEQFNFVRTDLVLYQSCVSTTNQAEFFLPRAVILFESQKF